MGKETDIKWKYEKRKITFCEKMLPKWNQVLLTQNQRNHKQKTTHNSLKKKNTNQQIIPTHNRDNENCDIADKREYEVNLDKNYFLINFSCFRETWKIQWYA